MSIFDVTTPDWMLHPGRNCAIPDEFEPPEIQHAADMWFPTEIGEARYAKRLCQDCPVQRQCFLYAYNAPELEGVWGGTTTFERNSLRAKIRKAA